MTAANQAHSTTADSGFSLIDDVKYQLLDQIENDSIQLPTLPEIALTIREVANSPHTTSKDLCRVIEQDPGIAARVIKVANSPLFRGSLPIETLTLATSRLGIRYTANFVTGIAMRQIFQPTKQAVERLLRETWDISATIAGCAMRIAKSDMRFQTEQATLAGLTHRIGALPILVYAETNPELIKDSRLLSCLINEIHGELGKKILQQWDFPVELVSIPENYQNPNREAEHADYADVISISYLQCIAAGKIEPSLFAGDTATNPEATTAAHQRLNLRGQTSESEQQELIEHIDMSSDTFDL